MHKKKCENEKIEADCSSFLYRPAHFPALRPKLACLQPLCRLGSLVDFEDHSLNNFSPSWVCAKYSSWGLFPLWQPTELHSLNIEHKKKEVSVQFIFSEEKLYVPSPSPRLICVDEFFWRKCLVWEMMAGQNRRSTHPLQIIQCNTFIFMRVYSPKLYTYYNAYIMSYMLIHKSFGMLEYLVKKKAYLLPSLTISTIVVTWSSTNYNKHSGFNWNPYFYGKEHLKIHHKMTIEALWVWQCQKWKCQRDTWLAIFVFVFVVVFGKCQ